MARKFELFCDQRTLNRYVRQNFTSCNPKL